MADGYARASGKFGILCAIGFGLYAARSGLHAPGMVLLGGAFGLLCSCINLLMIFPTIGLGCFGFNAGLQPLLGSLYNHVVFGLALGIWWAPGMARGAALAP